MDGIVVLLVEDNPGDVELLEYAIADAEAAKIKLLSASTLADAISCLSSKPVDLVLMDLNLPDSIGYATFQAVKANSADCPIIILSGIYDEALAMQAIRDGAQDFLVKGQYDNAGIIRALRYAIERKRLELALRESENRLAETHGLLHLGQWSQDLASGELTWSEESYKIFGLPLTDGEIVTAWEKIVHPDDRSVIDEQNRRILDGESAFSSVYRIIRPDDEIRHVECHVKVKCDKSGNAISVHGTNQDVTERVRSREARDAALAEAERANQAKSEFLAAMSHEIRTPMAGVIGMADLILETDLSPLQLDWATSIKSSGESLMTILNEILDQSKLEVGKLEISRVDFHLPSTIEETTQLFGPKIDDKGLKLVVELDDTVPEGVHGDSLRIGQILSNLLSNALKFTKTGSITVSVGHEPADGDNFMLRISVTDSGIGLSEKAKDRLFSAFTQADSSTSRTYGGTGLGLSISKQLVELMHGKIGVESTEGTGSTFWFEVTCQHAQTKVTGPEKRRSLDRWVASRPLRVLIAEDNRVNQQLIHAILGNLNHKVTVADNGRMTCDYVQAGDFDLILMDIRMPIMDGLEATATIRSMDSGKSNIPIIALTADISAGNIDEYRDIGMNDVCAKPLDLPILLKAINKILGEEIHTSVPNAPSVGTNQQESDADMGPEDGAPNVANFSHVLERVSNIVDQRSELERQNQDSASEFAGIDAELMADLIDEFVHGVDKKCNEMKTSLADLVGDPSNDEARGMVKDVSHVLKGQGSTFGYLLITTIATETNDFVNGKDTIKSEDVQFLSNHVDAISLVAAKGMSGHGGKAGRILMQGLRDFS